MKRISKIILFVCAASLSGAMQISAAQKISDNEILSKIKHYDQYTREVRRHLHFYPEVGGQEVETVKYLKERLAEIGTFEICDVPGSTGFYAILDTHKPGKTIGLRTDIDGLPVTESNVNGEGHLKPFVSKNQGFSQACGHDGHMAIMLTTIRALYDWRDRLTGKYVFLFEEGEETNTGIRPMIAAIKDIHFDAIYGNHLAANVPSGMVYIKPGSVMAGMAMLSWQVFGRGGHASRPDQSVNPIFASTAILNSVAVAWNQQRDITKLVTLGITQFHGGETWNVIPDSVYIGGTLRFFDWEAGVQSLELIKEVATTVAKAHDCTVRFGEKMTAQVPPVVNDKELATFAQKAIGTLFPGHITTDEGYNWYASETFALYNQLCPTLFTLVGVQNKELGTTAVHHTAAFDIDEDALQYGIGAMLRFATGY